MTVLERVPIPSIWTSTLSPGDIGPIPAGVPVVMMSPGIRVIILDMNLTRKGIEKIKLFRLDDCLSFPFKKVLSFIWEGSTSVAMQGPTAANVSKDLALVN
jgi:hypothetical protein